MLQSWYFLKEMKIYMDVNFLIFFLVQTTGFDYINYLLNYNSPFGELLVNPVTMCSDQRVVYVDVAGRRYRQHDL